VWTKNERRRNCCVKMIYSISVTVLHSLVLFVSDLDFGVFYIRIPYLLSYHSVSGLRFMCVKLVRMTLVH